MTTSTRQAIPHKLPTLLCCFGIAMVSNSALAESVLAIGATIQNGRYSVTAVQPSVGQLDLPLITKAIKIPSDVERVGEALHWMLRDSGYRLAADSVLSDEAKAMLELPLPAAHRRFDPMPLKSMIELLIGPAFHIVQDPVYRLIAFERCADTSAPTSTGGAQ